MLADSNWRGRSQRFVSAFSAFHRLLNGRQEEHPACKNPGRI